MIEIFKGELTGLPDSPRSPRGPLEPGPPCRDKEPETLEQKK